MWVYVLAGLGVLVATIGLVCAMRTRYLLATVRGPSMQPALDEGDRVLVRRRALSRIAVGDLVMFDEVVDLGSLEGLPPGARILSRREQARRGLTPDWVIKRVRSVPGDPVPRAEVRALADADHDVVPAGSLVVLGDNPAVSHDSRAYGYLDGSQVYGVVRRKL